MARDAASAKPRGVKLGGSKGFGFIAYETHEEAKLAAETLNGKVLPDPEGRRPTEAATALKAAQEALAKATEDDKEAPAELIEKVEAATKALIYAASQQRKRRGRARQTKLEAGDEGSAESGGAAVEEAEL